ncbi:MAG: DUF2267 domain-containing protein [bacterium]
MKHNFEKYARDANIFLNELAKKLGHPEEKDRTYIVLRSVLHTLRDRITISESLNLIAQLPMFMKAIYVDDWKYMEKPVRMNNVEEFNKYVENEQAKYGETEFNWQKSTTEIVQITIGQLSRYVSEGEIKDILAQMPEELNELFVEAVGH